MSKTAFLFLLQLLVSNGNAQYKTGGINTETIFEKIPAVVQKQMDSVFAMYQDSLNKQYEKLQTAITTALERWMKCDDCPPPPDSTKQSWRSLLISQYQDLNKFQQEAQSLIQQKAAALRMQFFACFKELVKPVAFECGYDIILDLCAENLLPVPGCTDITRLILQKLKW